MDMKKRNVSFILLFIMGVFLSSHSFGQFVVDDTENPVPDTTVDSNFTAMDLSNNEPVTEKEEDDGYHFGIWVNYQQQFGGLGDKLLTIGGPSFGFNLGRHFFIGAGIYSSFGNVDLTPNKNSSMVYGGGIVGFRWNPKSPVVFRTQVLVGAVAFDTISQENPGMLENRNTSLIVVPEVALDIRLVSFLYLSIAANYRYVADLPGTWDGMQGLGALSGIVSLGLSF